jgi:hypothetical protein
MKSLSMRNLLLATFLFLLSCNNRGTHNYYAFETLNTSLLETNNRINRSTDVITKSLEDRLSDPATSSKSKIWYPKAVKLHELSMRVYGFIDTMKADIKKAAGITKSGNREIFEKDNKDAVRQIIKERGVQLYEKLISFKDSVLAIDQVVRYEFDTSLFILPQPYNKSESMQQQFLKDFFDDLPAIGALAVLSKFQNTVCTAENNVISLIHSQTAYHPIHYWPWPIITQSSSILRTGEDLKIVAGIGEFMVTNKMEVTINGSKIPVNDIGVAEYNFKTSSIAGTYKIPVKLTYSDQDANLRVIERIITYTVKND